MRKFLRRVATPPLVVLAALLFLVEEYLWDRLSAALARLARLPAVARVEAAIAALAPYPAMTLFLVPAIMLVPIKLAAVYMMATGHLILGVAVVVVAKLLGTAIVARLFHLCQPSLLSVPWFRRLYDWVLATRDRLYGSLRAMPAWRATVDAVHRTKALLARRRSWLAARFLAARRSFRRSRA